MRFRATEIRQHVTRTDSKDGRLVAFCDSSSAPSPEVAPVAGIGIGYPEDDPFVFLIQFGTWEARRHWGLYDPSDEVSDG